jgi:hypothetical protein
MFLPELEVLLADGRIEDVLFIRPPEYSDWEIHFILKEMDDSIAHFLQVRSTGEKKAYTSIDRALETLRRLGYKGNVEIQG